MRTLPAGFTAEIESYGTPWGATLIDALTSTQPSVSVRINPLKVPHAVAAADDDEKVPWSQFGFYLPERPVFALDPAWHQGLYYVQDSSSMAVEAAVREITAKYLPTNRPISMLDACAAPGGKTIAALSALPQGSCVIANEYMPDRARILAENLSKYGSPDVVAVTSCDTAMLRVFDEAFDIVIADVPCSGEGMMRKDDQAIDQWSEKLVADCASLQREIVRKLWRTLRPGGFLIYSTCTFNRHENEDNIATLALEFEAESMAVEALESIPEITHGLDPAHPSYRFLPGICRGEGLFMAVLRKPGEVPEEPWHAAGRVPGVSRTPLAPGAGKLSGIDAATYSFASDAKGTSVWCYPTVHTDYVRAVMALRPMRTGTPVATVKGRDLAPAAELALSTILPKQQFPEAPLDYRAAIEYLRGNALSDIPGDLPRGFILPSYRGFPLGFAKNIGRRANNLFPDALRLRLQSPAEEPADIITY